MAIGIEDAVRLAAPKPLAPAQPELAQTLLKQSSVKPTIAKPPLVEGVKPPTRTIIGFVKGDKAKIVSRYGDTPVGAEGQVIKSWIVKSGPMTGQEYATLDFGANLTGQRLRNTYPSNVLQKVATKPLEPSLALLMHQYNKRGNTLAKH